MAIYPQMSLTFDEILKIFVQIMLFSDLDILAK